jgi:hypothetical protein
MNANDFWAYSLALVELAWSIPFIRNLAIAILISNLLYLWFTYWEEKNQIYSYDLIPGLFLLIANASIYVGIVSFGAIMAQYFGIEMRKGHVQGFIEVLMAAVVLFSSAALAFIYFRLTRNAICWHLKTPLWPWNPFVQKVGYENIVRKNQRAARKRDTAKQRE